MSSGNIISPAMIFIIVILAIVVFISGLIHLLVRFIMKQRSSNFQSNNGNLDSSSGSNAFQRQLQHLFNLHDSGLDQAFIDALPVFLYKDLVGVNEEPYDCPVCLCELSKQDKLRLLPLCGHAFHIDCIDTWLLSNSTCPVCRGTLLEDGFSIENPSFVFDDSRIEEENVPKPCENENKITKKRVFSVRLGKFKNINEEGRGEDVELGETSNSNLDGRRCLSLGSCRYVVADTELQVALCPNSNIDKIKISNNDKNPSNGGDAEAEEAEAEAEAEAEGKKIKMGSKGESFSVSKVWQWSSKKGKFGNHREKHVSDFSYPFSGSNPQPQPQDDAFSL